MPGGSRGCVSIKYAQHHCPLTGSCAGLDLHTAGLPVFLFFPSFCLPRHLVRRVFGFSDLLCNYGWDYGIPVCGLVESVGWLTTGLSSGAPRPMVSED